MQYKVEYTDKDYNQFMELAAGGATALYIYSPNVLFGGKVCQYDERDRSVRAIAIGGTIMVPSSFFTKFLNIDESLLTVEEKTVRGNIEYLPVLAVAKHCGFCAKSYYEGRLAVIGAAEHIAAMDSNPMLEEAGAYAVFGEYDISLATSADYKQAKDNWRMRLVGSPEINDLNEPTISAKVAWLDKKCNEALAKLNRNADRVILFGDKAPVESDDLWQQYICIENMALAWGAYGCKNYHNESILSDILDCLEWMYENMYGEAEIAGTGWRNVREFNWWHWFVGAPDCLTNIMLIIEDYLTMEQKEKYLKCFKWVFSIMWQHPFQGSSSRLVAGTKCALLLEDSEALAERQRDCDTGMGLSEHGACVHKDYVNWTHSFPHNISYGVLNLQRGLFVASILAGTALDFSGPKRYTQFNLVKYCFEPAMYRMQGFVMFSGRSTFGVEQSYGASVLAAALPMIGCFGEDEDLYLKRFIKRNTSTPELAEKVKQHCSFFECAKLNSILNDETISTENDYEYAHAWFTGDRAAQHRNDYAFGIAMSSKREKAYECINSANKTGWYTADGATYLYTNYDGNCFDGSNFLLNNINVAYRFPGTTEDSQPRVARSIRNEFEWFPEKSFAGGMQFYDKYIVAAMDFGAFHCEGPDSDPDDYGYGGSQPIHANDLVAKKSWFCFDDEIVCLGAGISSTMDSMVHTTLDHRRVAKDGLTQLVGIGKYAGPAAEIYEYKKGEWLEKVNTGARWVLMEGHAGYLFPKGGAVFTSRYKCEEANGQEFFEVRIEHGKNPENATYAYVIIPYATKKKLEEYYNAPDIDIISNTEKLQAVREKNIGVSGYVFYEAGECDGIIAQTPCMITLGEKEGEKLFAITDPTHEQQTLTVTLDRKINVIEKSPRISVEVFDEKTVITVNVAEANGRKYEIKFS